MTTCEATCWIHELLEEELGAKEALKFSSHSCKATLLTWAGMTNIFSREERTLLGHHVEAQTRSSTTYSRDSQVMLQYKVSKLITMIKTDKLKPDASRAERLAMLVGDDAQEEEESVAFDDSIDYASSNDDSEDVTSPCAEFDAPELTGFDDTDRGDFSLVTGADQWLVHAFTGAFHFGMALDSKAAFKERALEVGISSQDSAPCRKGAEVGRSAQTVSWRSRTRRPPHNCLSIRKVLEGWTQLLFDRVCQDPPAGYKHISIEQIVTADRHFWVKVSEMTRSKIHTTVDGQKAVDIAIKQLSHHPEVQFHMLPLPTYGAACSAASSSDVRVNPYENPSGDWRRDKKGEKGKGKKGEGKGKIVVRHPKDPHNSLPDVLKEALFHVLTTDPIELAKHRLQVVLAIKRRATELATQETNLKESMNPILARVLAPKKLLLWRGLMQETGYGDIAIFDMIKNGIPLYGEHDIPNGATLDWRPASSSADELLGTSVWRRKAIQGASPDLDETQQNDLHEATLAEVQKGHLVGPMDEEQVSIALGSSDWIFSPRFAVYQGEEKKIRPIDDCKRSGLNSAYTVNFKLELFDIDSLACLMAAVAQAANSGSYECELQDGSLIGGELRKSVASDEWLGRTLDLSRAYKQLGIDEKSRNLSVVGYQHQGTWKYYLNHVLPFGAAASVYSFNRVSKSLHHILCKLLFSLSTCFYDDFPTISPKASASILTKSLSAVLNLLGWDHAQVGSKAVDFASDFAASLIRDDLKLLCGLAIDLLNSLSPRFFKAGSMNDSLLTFTDGAWEAGTAGAGAVIYDPCVDTTCCFEIEVPQKLIDLWISETGEQIISQIEMFALVCVRFRYATRLHNRVGISWIDNESAKYACIKGTSLSPSMLVMCRVLQQIEAEKPSSVWYERVSSHSNPGDMPSRKQNIRASKLFSAQAESVWVPPSELVDAIFMLHEKPFGVVHTLFKGEQTSATNTKQG
eukprot:symbB.v1.2.035248.t2/scaffold4699.1/size36177/2